MSLWLVSRCHKFRKKILGKANSATNFGINYIRLLIIGNNNKRFRRFVRVQMRSQLIN